MDLRKVIAETPELQGSYIDDLFTAMAAGEFRDIPEEEAVEGEVLIGEMDLLEKALHALRGRYAKEEKDLIYRLREGTSAEEEGRLKRALGECRRRFKMTEEMMWGNIVRRLTDKAPSFSGGVNWILKPEFKIYAAPPAAEEEGPDPFAQLMEMVGARR